MFENIPAKVNIVEVGPRDGLQNEKKSLSLEDKLTYIELLVKSGLKTIEAASFVRADKIPQMADAVELFTKLRGSSGFHELNFPCLVPNVVGYENAKACGVEEISLFSATSDAFTKKNINCTVNESFKRMSEVVSLAKKDGMKIRAYISTAFGCPYAGDMSAEKLLEVSEKFLDLGVYEISIGDTIGVAKPKQVYDYLNILLRNIPVNKLAMHFHDTRGMAIANIVASLELGIRTFDSSSGGLGGCPYAKGASGNVATEDLIYLFDSMGIEHGVDLEKIVTASKFILDKADKKTPSKYLETILNEEKI